MSLESFRKPTSVDEAVALLGELGDDAKIVAGGQSLAVLLRMKLIEASTLVGLGGIAELDALEATGSGLRVGARITHHQVASSPEVRERWPVLVEAAAAVATPQIRNLGTICGNAAHGYPLADPPAALLALGAEAHVRSLAGQRTIPLDAFFLDFMTTALQPDDLLAQISVPAPAAGSGGAYEVFRQRALDYPTIGVAVQVSLGPGGECQTARIGLNGAGPAPIRARRAEDVLAGQPLTADVLEAAAREAGAESDPPDDLDGSAAYKRRLVGVLLRRAVSRAVERAGARTDSPR